MTNQLKDELLTNAITLKNESNSVVWESSKLFETFAISATDIEYLVNDFKEKGLIQNLHVANMYKDVLFTFYVTHKADVFLRNGGYPGIELALKKKNQIEADVSEAAIRSANASEASALAAIKSAREATISRYIAIFALCISIIALVVECQKP